MLAATFTGLTLVLGAGWYLFSLATNSYLRAQAEKHPNSISFWYVKLADSFLKATLFKPVFEKRDGSARDAKSAPSSEGVHYIRNLHDAADVAELVSIRRSFSVSIDLTRGISPFFIEKVGNPMLFLGVFCLALFISTLLLTLLFAHLFGLWPGLLGLVLGPTVVFGVFLFTPGENGFLLTLQKLHFSPFTMVSIDNKMISTTGFSGRWTSRNVDGFIFEPLVDGVTLGVCFRTAVDTPQRALFRFPRFFEDSIMSEAEVKELCGQLNKLVKEVRDLPSITFDHSIVSETANIPSKSDPSS
jgi:hypothetical protein